MLVPSFRSTHTPSRPGKTISRQTVMIRETHWYAMAIAERSSCGLVTSVAAATAVVERAFAGRPGVELDRLDGLTVAHPGGASDGTGQDPMWWFNLRPSNTEPLLRLNAEAADAATMTAVRDEVLGLVRG